MSIPIPKLFLSLLPLFSLANADTTYTIATGATYGTWQGWGVSLAWWAAEFGAETTLADLFFTTDTTTYNSASVPGLGLNIVRYNAGACSSNANPDGDYIVYPSTMIATREMEGYWLDWDSTDPSSSSWSWTVDSNQRAMMLAAQTRGANYIELFSNSPMWWMTTNNDPAGSNSGSADNLESWNWDQHAIYLASIALYASENWGVTFTSVEPFNEPISDWWNGKSGTQEGCHFGTATQNEVAIYLREELDSRGLDGVLVAASDENTYDLAITTWAAFNSTAKASVGRVNVHGYELGSGNRAGLYSAVKADGKLLWNTEYGEDDATGSELASNLLLDLTTLHPTAWVYWQALDSGGWGLIDATISSGTLGAVSQKYYVLAQFTRHITEGMTILTGVGSSNAVVAAYDAAAEKLVIVAVNWDDAQYLDFDLGDFAQGGVSGALVSRWSTQISSGDQYVEYSDTYLSGTVFWSYFAENQVMTFEVENVVL